MNTNTQRVLTCDMIKGCQHPVTHIDHKGWIYCKNHGEQRRGYMPCRCLTKFEIETLKQGKPIKRY